jgi:hypothetical protein
MPKHLKVVDIMDENDVMENTEKIEVTNDNIIEQQSELIEQQSELIEQPVIDPIIDKHVKGSHLVNCPRCNRKMTNRTLLYAHEKLCKKRDEVYIPKSIKKQHLRASDLVKPVKEALTIIDNEKQEKQIKTKIENPKPVVQPPIRQLEPIIDSIPLYNDLRKGRIAKQNVVMTNLFKNAF